VHRRALRIDGCRKRQSYQKLSRRIRYEIRSDFDTESGNCNAKAVPVVIFCCDSSNCRWNFLIVYLYSNTKNDIPISFTLRQTSFTTGPTGLDEKLANDALSFLWSH
jgi:hypothetical protein